MKKISPNLVGLICGISFALLHAVWSLMVAFGLAQWYLDWILGLHFVNNPFTIQPFSLTTASMLVIVVFIVWYVVGWISGVLWNWLVKKK